MRPLIYALCGLAAAIACLVAAPGRAQTAADINRLNAAIQVCNSGFAATPECARLRGQLGAGGAPGLGVVPGLGGVKGAAAAGALGGLLGAAMGPRATPPAAAPAAASSFGIDPSRAIAACVARAQGDQAQIDRCLAIANGGAAPPR